MVKRLDERYSARSSLYEDKPDSTHWSYITAKEEITRITAINELINGIKSGTMTTIAILPQNDMKLTSARKISVRCVDDIVNFKYDNGSELNINITDIRVWFLPAVKLGSLFTWRWK